MGKGRGNEEGGWGAGRGGWEREFESRGSACPKDRHDGMSMQDSDRLGLLPFLEGRPSLHANAKKYNFAKNPTRQKNCIEFQCSP